ncbi:Fur family transcriptional regulator [Nocardioides aurantiacus]|uniref:Fur family zinc uptake regulator n=1 Tax=Nocardioides aurantiacus TaxID=86796 RepID=A0A3N2CV88_9ACTN|nr:Fur family transcriptional regulator [Nocardioides aurantiacus]ROR91455.1 Fur family zinc uptake regulator [Nocardioides aurantiacus]
MTSTESTLGRPTRQRRAIMTALESGAEFRTAQEIHAQLDAAGAQVGLSTVYRTLQSLADAGEVDSLRTEAGESSYRRCSDSHHHHLVCRSCGTAVEIEGPAVERWTRAVAEESRFRDVSHTLEIFGTCADC